MNNNGGVVIFKKSGNGGIVLIDSEGKAKQQVNQIPECDAVFVIDTTGSMDDKIDGLLQTCQHLVDGLTKKEINPRIAIVAFGDLTVFGGKIVVTQFMSSPEAVKRTLAHIPRISGGGNDGESSLEAMAKVLKLETFRPNAIKVAILLTDEPAHRHKLKPQDITRRLKQAGILTYVISDKYEYFQEMARETGGKWFEISSSTNFLSILDQLFKKVTQTVVAVQTEANGDVQKYLQLTSGENARRNA